MGKIVLNLAMSLDGYIADPDGGFDWIKGEDGKGLTSGEPYDFEAFLASVGTIVMGAKAYEDCPAEAFETFKDKAIVVATSRPLTGGDNVTFVNGAICEHVVALQEASEAAIWIYGGGGLADAFIKADVIDTYIVGVIPIILGEGRPLFLGGTPTLPLHLVSQAVSDGIVLMTYNRMR
ncbi:dihydrofolate reductase family protein [Fusibacter sp. JL298sf-3]